MSEQHWKTQNDDVTAWNQWYRLARQQIRANRQHDVDRPSCLDTNRSSTVSEVAPIKPLYTQEDLTGLPLLNTLPGFEPYVRGPYASMYVGRPWTIRQYAGLSTAEDSNAFYRRLLSGGAQGISVAFDLPTQRGYDSDHPDVAGDVGKAGVAIDSVDDMVRLFEGIPLDATSVSMTINGAVLPILASLIVAAEEQGVSPHQLCGTVQNDILKEYLVRNTYVYPPLPSLQITADIMAYCAAHLPRFNSISVSGYHLHEAGAPAALELAYALANGREYLRAAVERGLSVDECAPRFSFFFGIGMNFLTEVAKLRAARLLWCEIVERFGPDKAESKRLRMHCQTSGWSLTQQDPYNNVVRTTIEAMAGVMGGTQSLHTNAFDEALALPTDESARIARNTQLILQKETGLANVIDPWGGSYLMESLTHGMAESARKLIKEVEQVGGMVRAIELGVPKRRIDQAAAARQARIDGGWETIVGVNQYQSEEQPQVAVTRIDNQAVRENQLQRLARLKSQRDENKVTRSLEALRYAALMDRRDGGPNLLQATIDAVRQRATVGEVSKVLADVFGRYTAPTMPIRSAYGAARRHDASWQALQEEVARWINRWSLKPHLLIAKLGQDGHDRGMRVVAAALSDLGFEVNLAPLFATPELLVDLAEEQEVHMIGVSTQAGAHLHTVPRLQQLMRERFRQVPIVVGGVLPAADRDQLLQDGVEQVFCPGETIDRIARTLLSIVQTRIGNEANRSAS